MERRDDGGGRGDDMHMHMVDVFGDLNGNVRNGE
jgi:hypothetical protein